MAEAAAASENPKVGDESRRESLGVVPDQDAADFFRQVSDALNRKLFFLKEPGKGILKKTVAGERPKKKKRVKFSMDTKQERLLDRMLIHPASKSLLYIEYITLAFRFLDFFWTPFRVCFVDRWGEIYFDLPDFWMDLYFTWEIVLHFFIAYYDGDTLVRSYSKIRNKYLYSRDFVFDFFSLFTPYIALAFLPLHKLQAVTMVARAITLVRVAKLVRFFREKEANYRENVQIVQMLKFLLILLGTNHWLACLWYMLASSTVEGPSWFCSYQFATCDDPNTSIMVNYVRSLYFALSTITGTGIGDFKVSNQNEVLYMVLSMILNLMLYSYVTGTVQGIIYRHNETVRKSRKKFSLVEAYIARNNLSEDLTNDLLTFYTFQSQKANQASHEAILGALPRSLKIKVTNALYKEAFSQVFLFRNCANTFVDLVVSRLRPVYYMANETFVRANDVSRELYIVINGEVEIISPERDTNDEERVLTSQQGGVYGDVAFILGIFQPYSIRAKWINDVSVLLLSKKDYAYVTGLYTDQEQIIMTNAMEHYSDDKDPHIKELVDAEMLSRKLVSLANATNAVCTGNVEEVERFIAAGNDVNALNHDGRSLLHHAAQHKHPKIVKTLINAGAEFYFVDSWGNQAIDNALLVDDVVIFKTLYDNGSEFELKNAASVLNAASSTNDVDKLRLLMDHRVSPNSCDTVGRTPLHFAAQKGNLQAVLLLLQANCDFNKRDHWGTTPLLMAIEAGHDLIANLLIQKGAQLGMDASIEEELMVNTLARNDVKALQLFVRCDIDIDAKGYDQRCLLHMAASSGMYDTVALFLSHGAAVNTVGRWGQTPLHLAITHGHTEVAKLLMRHGGCVFSEDPALVLKVLNLSSLVVDDETMPPHSCELTKMQGYADRFISNFHLVMDSLMEEVQKFEDVKTMIENSVKCVTAASDFLRNNITEGKRRVVLQDIPDPEVEERKRQAEKERKRLRKEKRQKKRERQAQRIAEVEAKRKRRELIEAGELTDDGEESEDDEQALLLEESSSEAEDDDDDDDDDEQDPDAMFEEEEVKRQRAEARAAEREAHRLARREAKRISFEKAEAARIAAEEAARLAAEEAARVKAEKEAAEKAERDRLRAEREEAERQRLLAEKLAAEEAEKERQRKRTLDEWYNAREGVERMNSVVTAFKEAQEASNREQRRQQGDGNDKEDEHANETSRERAARLSRETRARKKLEEQKQQASPLPALTEGTALSPTSDTEATATSPDNTDHERHTHEPDPARPAGTSRPSSKAAPSSSSRVGSRVGTAASRVGTATSRMGTAASRSKSLHGSRNSSKPGTPKPLMSARSDPSKPSSRQGVPGDDDEVMDPSASLKSLRNIEDIPLMTDGHAERRRSRNNDDDSDRSLHESEVDLSDDDEEAIAQAETNPPEDAAASADAGEFDGELFNLADDEASEPEASPPHSGRPGIDLPTITVTSPPASVLPSAASPPPGQEGSPKQLVVSLPPPTKPLKTRLYVVKPANDDGDEESDADAEYDSDLSLEGESYLPDGTKRDWHAEENKVAAVEEVEEPVVEESSKFGKLGEAADKVEVVKEKKVKREATTIALWTHESKSEKFFKRVKTFAKGLIFVTTQDEENVPRNSLHPRFSRIWAFVLAAAGMYYLLMTPFRFSFTDDYKLGNVWYDYLVDLILLLELSTMIGKACISRRNGGRATVPPGFYKELALQGVAVFPIDGFALASGLSGEVIVVLRLPKLLTVRKLNEFYRLLRSSHNISIQAVDAVEALLAMLTFVHWMACIWFYLPRLSGADLTWLSNCKFDYCVNQDQYTSMSGYWIAMYYSASMITVVGYGDIIPVSTLELTFTVVNMVANMTLYAFVLIRLSFLLASQDSAIMSKRATYTQLQHFEELENMPVKLRSELNSFFDYFLQKGMVSDEDNVWNEVPRSLQVRIARHLYLDHINKAYFFQGCSDGFLDTILSSMQEIAIKPGEVFVTYQTIGTQLFFVLSGSVEELVHSSEVDFEVTDSHREGCLGDMSFFFKIPYKNSLRANMTEECTLLVLREQAYKHTIELYPDEEDKILAKLLARQKENESEADDGKKKKTNVADNVAKMVSTKKARQLLAKGWFLLHYAKVGNLEKMVKLLDSDENLKVSFKDQDRRSSIHLAAKAGHLNIVQELVARKANVSAKDRFGSTPLQEALKYGHVAVVEFLLEQGGEFAFSDLPDRLCALARDGDLVSLQKMGSYALDLGVANFYQRTPLHYAATEGHQAVVEMLVDCGVDINPIDKMGCTPFMDALRREHVGVVAYLKHKGARIHAAKMARALNTFAFHGDLDAVKLRYETGVDIFQTDENKRTTLHLAACEGHVELVSWLLGKGFDPSPVDAFGRTPLDDAVKYKHTLVIALLRANGGLENSPLVATKALKTATDAAYAQRQIVDSRMNHLKMDVAQRMVDVQQAMEQQTKHFAQAVDTLANIITTEM